MPENTAAPRRSPSDSGTLDRFFRLTERGTTIGTEVRGGLATFFAMSYIVVLNPLILGLIADANGSELGIVTVAASTSLISGIMTILMGVNANQPFAMAAGLGINAFLAATISTTPELTWPELMGLVIWAGIIMFILVLTGFREAVFNAVPQSLTTAIVCGIGLFISFIGFVNAGFVTASTSPPRRPPHGSSAASRRAARSSPARTSGTPARGARSTAPRSCSFTCAARARGRGRRRPRGPRPGRRA